MKKKLFTLLTLALVVCSGAWADTETIFSATPTTAWSVPGSTTDAEITSSYATISGGKMYVTNSQTAAKDLIKEQGEMAFQHTNGNTFFKVVLDKALEAGDVISARMQSRTDTDLGLWFTTASSYPSSAPTAKIELETASSQAWVTAPTYTVATGDGICGETTFYIYRATGKSTYFNTFKITREVAATLPVITTQPVGANYTPNATATALSIAATASAGTLSYQWYSNTTESTEGATAISGATSEEYTPSTDSEGTTYYYCVVTDANGSTTSDIVAIKISNATTAIVGYTEAINGAKLDARVLTGADNITISAPSFGSNITDYKGTSKAVVIDGTSYNNTDSWRKSQKNSYDNQYVGYTLTVASGYKMNISHVSARIAVADDTYNWYVEILNGAGTQVWKSGEKTSKKTGTSGVVDADVTDKDAIQGLTGNVTVNLYVKQDGSTKYFSINYLQLTVETEVDVRPTYTMSVSSNDDTMGTVTPDDGSTVTEGESVAFTATPNTEYKFVKWVIDGVDQTANPYVIENVNAAHTAEAYFAKRYTVSYELGDYTGTLKGKALCNVRRGNGIDEVYSDDADNYTIPAYAHKYLYREGYVFDKWQDGDGNTYASGDVIAMTKDITLTPTWKATSQSLSASSTENVVTWSFAKANIIFVDWQSNDNYGYYVQDATVNGEAIAVPMSIIKGKVANYTRTDAIAQTNQNTTFTIPAVSGMTVEIANAYVAFSTTTIAGSTEYTKSNSDKTITYTYTGSDATIDIVVGENNQYLNTIKVTYPANLSSVSITPTYAKTTYVTTKALDFSAVEGLKAYVATAAAAGKVTLEEVGAVPAGTPLMLVGTAGTEYTVPVAATAEDPATNMFQAGDGTTEFDGTTYDYILYSDGLFYQIGSGTVATTKAYLHCEDDPTASGSRTLAIIFGNETTGISNVNANVKENSYYDLQGRSVAHPQKGLYIVNGKKVIIK